MLLFYLLHVKSHPNAIFKVGWMNFFKYSAVIGSNKENELPYWFKYATLASNANRLALFLLAQVTIRQNPEAELPIVRAAAEQRHEIKPSIGL